MHHLLHHLHRLDVFNDVRVQRGDNHHPESLNWEVNQSVLSMDRKGVLTVVFQLLIKRKRKVFQEGLGDV